MSAIAHASPATWAHAHRLLLFVALAVVLAAIAVTVVLLTRDTTAATTLPDLPYYEDPCVGAPVGAAC
jgi:hypothetical protein